MQSMRIAKYMMSKLDIIINLASVRATAEPTGGFWVSVHSPLPYAGIAVILAAISAGETPAIPGGVNAYVSDRVYYRYT